VGNIIVKPPRPVTKLMPGLSNDIAVIIKETTKTGIAQMMKLRAVDTIASQ